MRVLAGDIGGTNTRLCLAENVAGTIQLVHQQNYASQTFPDFLSIVESFLEGNASATTVDAACFAVAGPVHEQHAKVTNLPWMLEATQLKKELSIEKLYLLNDFQAVGYGLDSLSDDQFVCLQTGQVEKQARRALIGAGTGLGISSLVYQNDCYVPYPSEGGHVGFAPFDELQGRLLKYLQSSMDYVAYEHLLSGSGLLDIYRFFLEEHGAASSFSGSILQAADSAVEISRHALLGDDQIALQTLDCFIDIYAAQAGNVALNYMATGGVYIAGGIAPKIIELLKSERFLAAFHRKGVMSELMQRFPINVVMDEKVGLLGAASFAFQSLLGTNLAPPY